MQIRVLGAFYLGGKCQEPGSEIEVGDHLVADLVARGKAEVVTAKVPVKGPMTTDSAPVLVKGKERKGARDAGQ